MIRASVFLVLVGLAAVSAFRGQGGGYANGLGSFASGGGASAGASGTIDTSAKIGGKASVGQGSFAGGLFDFNDLSVEGTAEGSLKAQGTAQGSLGGFAQGQGAGQFQGNGNFAV